MNAPEAVLVTGATGLVGRRLVGDGQSGDQQTESQGAGGKGERAH
ncbi:MAG: hypothetical protein QF391_12235 [Myxococcota bacterium]|nr:hypothetical protein [Myxococcota bacterium]